MNIKDYKQFDKFSPEYGEIIEHSRALKGQYSERNKMFEIYEHMYMMDWDHGFSRKQLDTIKLTKSPTARNKVLGAWRLLISQNPKFKVRSSTPDAALIEGMEKFISGMWEAAGTVNGRPLHHDIILSMLLYGEAHIGINTIRDFQAYNPDDKRVDRVGKQTPIIFDVWNPKTGYPEFDKFGLTAFFREVQVEKSWVRTNYAKLIEDDYSLQKKLEGDGTVTLRTFYDLKKYSVDIDYDNIICCEHGLPCIPISVTMADGSNLFDHPEDNRQPLLYTLAQSRLWERENLYLTVTTSNLFAMGCMPLLAYTHDMNSKLEVKNMSGVLIADLAKGESIDFIQSKGFLTNEMQNMGKMYEEYIDESTVYDSAFGGNNTAGTFSESSLLSVSARLPLVATQEQCGKALADAVDLALLTLKERKINFKKAEIDFKYKDIPEDLEVICKLDMNQPQEKLQRANEAAVILANGLASKQWAQENTIGIENTEEMEQEMVREKVTTALLDYKIQDLIQELQQQKQQQQQVQQQQLQEANQKAQQARQQAVMQQQQAQQQGSQMLQQQQQANMGGAQNIPRGQQLESDILQMVQQQAMANNMNANGQEQMPEGQAERLGGGGIPGGMPPEMGGVLPGMGMGAM